ncbi:hypothetical protein NA57DRAFT_74262 [Rhizodiscina lignyota]|uniref:YCII-related domain-containing protein n=1 Tax=Rhizodiscina lignyota TaxID=1504668 RepID=A0A9P4MAS8_9PEZI|nr:hypothetical protein NA57DRAFT_74262 [Rhizodiscina lignyota]
MASAKQEWLVIFPDHEGALKKRLEVRPKHIEAIVADGGKGFWLMGGALLERPLDGTEAPPPSVGSAMLCAANSKEEVLDRLKADLYTTAGVWDWNKIQIYPFKCAVRTAMDEVK